MTDKEKLIKIKKLADAMYYAAFNMTTDASLLGKAMDDYHQFTIYEYHKEEPVSEPQVKESAKIQHVNDTCKENGDSLTQEPVSEELEEAADRGMVEEIIINLKRVENDYRIDLTREIGWLRNLAQKGEEA